MPEVSFPPKTARVAWGADQLLFGSGSGGQNRRVRLNRGHVEVAAMGACIARHERSYKRNQQVLELKHYPDVPRRLGYLERRSRSNSSANADAGPVSRPERVKTTPTTLLSERQTEFRWDIHRLGRAHTVHVWRPLPSCQIGVRWRCYALRVVFWRCARIKVGGAAGRRSTEKSLHRHGYVCVTAFHARGSG